MACNVLSSAPEPYLQHIESRRHWKRVGVLSTIDPTIPMRMSRRCPCGRRRSDLWWLPVNGSEEEESEVANIGDDGPGEGQKE